MRARHLRITLGSSNRKVWLQLQRLPRLWGNARVGDPSRNLVSSHRCWQGNALSSMQKQERPLLQLQSPVKRREPAEGVARGQPPPAEEVSIGSQKNFKWRCSVGSCAHVREARPQHRSGSLRTGCPKCSRKRKMLRKHCPSLAKLRPDLVDEWDEARNGCSVNELSCGGKWQPWWCCQDCGKYWQTRISDQIKQRPGCQKCRKKK